MASSSDVDTTRKRVRFCDGDKKHKNYWSGMAVGLIHGTCTAFLLSTDDEKTRMADDLFPCVELLTSSSVCKMCFDMGHCARATLDHGLVYLWIFELYRLSSLPTHTRVLRQAISFSVQVLGHFKRRRCMQSPLFGLDVCPDWCTGFVRQYIDDLNSGDDRKLEGILIHLKGEFDRIRDYVFSDDVVRGLV